MDIQQLEHQPPLIESLRAQPGKLPPATRGIHGPGAGAGPPPKGAGDRRLGGAARWCAAMIAQGRAADAKGPPALLPAWRGPRIAVTGGLPGARLRRVVDYVEANLAGALVLAELSALVHMSPFHFARLFKQSTGVSPRQFVIRRRIEAAKRLLTEPVPVIREVARAVGFSQSHFTTCFRRVTGVTPRHYRGAVQVGPSSGPPAEIASGDEYRDLAGKGSRIPALR